MGIIIKYINKNNLCTYIHNNTVYHVYVCRLNLNIYIHTYKMAKAA